MARALTTHISTHRVTISDHYFHWNLVNCELVSLPNVLIHCRRQLNFFSYFLSEMSSKKLFPYFPFKRLVISVYMHFCRVKWIIGLLRSKMHILFIGQNMNPYYYRQCWSRRLIWTSEKDAKCTCQWCETDDFMSSHCIATVGALQIGA